MNWGIRITIVYLCFVALIVSLVVISSNNKSELVSREYYANELKYQDRINAIGNEMKLEKSIDYSIRENDVVILYPVKGIAPDFSGEIVFFRPSDSSKDLKIKMAIDKSGTQMVSKNILAKGVYKLCFGWSNNGKNYYKEQVINL